MLNKYFDIYTFVLGVGARGTFSKLRSHMAMKTFVTLQREGKASQLQAHNANNVRKAMETVCCFHEDVSNLSRWVIFQAKLPMTPLTSRPLPTLDRQDYI